MDVLYSDILPLGLKDGQQTIAETIKHQMELADEVRIAVGYVSAASLDELDQMVESCSIKRISLVMGMYYTEGMNERAYRRAVKLHQKWAAGKIGSVKAVLPFKYHGKVYCFYQNGQPFSAVVGSANLGVMKLEAGNRRQYELSVLIEDRAALAEIARHVETLAESRCSQNIDEIKDMPIIRVHNNSLNQVELVEPLAPNMVEYYQNRDSKISFYLKLKVPKAAERFLDDGKHYTKSNINVCYAAPRNKRKARDWFETQLTVGADIYHLEGYPQKNQPFFIVTDDGYWFKGHTTSDNNKQFSAVGDELIMGRWLKGRLAAAGLVAPVNDTSKDEQRLGMITEEMLAEYGCDRLLFQKTDKQAADEDGNMLDVWTLAFTSDKQ